LHYVTDVYPCAGLIKNVGHGAADSARAGSDKDS
jgi:hypothetical protein